MPRKAARLFLRVTDVRVERVQDITDREAVKEGCCCYLTRPMNFDQNGFEGYRGSYALIWDRLNKKRGFGWDINPWVFVISFERVNP
jgi:hypothetical protein